jgi:hypothetical protein
LSERQYAKALTNTKPVAKRFQKMKPFLKEYARLLDIEERALLRVGNDLLRKVKVYGGIISETFHISYR